MVNIGKVLLKHYRLCLCAFVIIFLLSVGSVALVYHQYLKNERKNKAIVNYCEDNKWQQNNENDSDFYFFNDDDLTCDDFQYLKPIVKKSTANICHDEESTSYYETKHYKIFKNIDDCLKSGGRLPYN